ncbi:hypothetical protein AXZ07_16425 [Pseudomonas mosselii]|uniref:Putative membrane protein n=1 Tax=Pseudomonas putida TaxID=303 RepID=A0A0N9MWP7_PSEPU|nr:putative membrane protein [Pseudomonas putida]KXG81719.1 hypothetical protein AXZ07_16425 [Pseudomonas mosselii]
MTKLEAAQLILPLVIGYFSVKDERLVDLKMFAFRCAMVVFITCQIHSIYILLTHSQLEFWLRYMALNIAAVGLLVLCTGAWVFNKYLRAELMNGVKRG